MWRRVQCCSAVVVRCWGVRWLGRSCAVGGLDWHRVVRVWARPRPCAAVCVLGLWCGHGDQDVHRPRRGSARQPCAVKCGERGVREETGCDGVMWEGLARDQGMYTQHELRALAPAALGSVLGGEVV